MTITELPLPTAPAGARRSTRDDLRAIPSVLRSEWIKLSSLRSNRIVFALTFVLNALAAYAVAVLVTDEVLIAGEVFVFPALLTAVLVLVTGILLLSSEDQHGTLALVFQAQPSRWVIVLGKAIVAVAVGLTLGAAGMVMAFIGAIAGGLEVGDTSAMAATAVWALLYLSLTAVIGLALGMIIRQSTGAIAGVLVWWFVAENLLRTFLPVDLARLLPFDAGYRVLEVGNDFDSPELIAAALTRNQYGLVFAGYTIVALAVGTVLLHRRDAS